MVFTKQDFLDFKFGDHWASEYGLIRVSNSKRYDANITPTLTDKTVEVPGNDGMYFFSTYHKQRQFTVNVAFDHITETQLRAIRVWLSGKEIKSLIFVEDLNKNASGVPQENKGRKYYAKVTGAPSLKYVPFDEYYLNDKTNNTTGSDNITRVISWDGVSTPVASNIPEGVVVPTTPPVTGTLEASANTLNKIYRVFNPDIQKYIDYITLREETTPNTYTYSWTYNKHIVYKGEGTIQFTCYDPYAYSIEQFNATNNPIVGGEVSTPFILTTTDGVNANTTITIKDGDTTLSSITITNSTTSSVEWNSNTGIVKDSTGPIAFTGNSMVLLPVGANLSITGPASVLTYYNRYY